MTWPGPPELGRGVVVRAGSPVPRSWSDVPGVLLSAEVIADDGTLHGVVDTLHRHWVGRKPVVVEWALGDDALSVSERCDEEPWQVGAGFLFPFERLRFLCFSNNYDGRAGDLRWWWSMKARRVGARPEGPADVVLANGSAAWIDGGPRGPLEPLGLPVIHGESIDAGLSTRVRAPAASEAELAPDQAAAVAHGSGPARIIAPAGSGKTRTLTARLRHMRDDQRIEQEHLMALAYNDRAAAELRDRLGADRATARTIHSLGWEILREARPGLALVDESESRRVLDRLVSTPKRANTDPIAPYLEALQRVRNGLLEPGAVEADRDDVVGFAAAFEPYRASLYEHGRVDHGEQVYGAIEALLTDPALRRRWQARCRHLLVDEFQDLTPAYVLLIRLLASPQLDVFGVGDDDQVIYGYDGADPGFLIDFDRYFPGAASHALTVSYRCPPEIVTAAVHLLSYNRRRIAKTIRAARTSGDSDAVRVFTVAGDGMGRTAADVISSWHESGVPLPQIAVLSRVNSSLIPVKLALVERGIATDDLLTSRSLERTTLRALFAWMRIGMRPDRIERTDLLEAVVRPGRRLNRIARELVTRRTVSSDDVRALADRLDGTQAGRWHDLCDDIDRVATRAVGGDAEALIRLIADDVGLGASARALDAGRGNAGRSGHLDDLVAVQRSAALHPDLRDFVEWLRSGLDRAPSPEGVTLSSVHRVKGMEWRHVVVFGADRGAMPHDLAEDLEEERRVFHVAITRAESGVVVLADDSRPSRFLAEMSGTDTRAATPPRPDATAPDGGAGRRGRAAREPSETAVLDGSTASLIDTLRVWRLETARRLGVPAYVVLHDRTIEEIATRRPATERELLAITGIGSSKLESYGDDILSVVDAAATSG